MHAQYYSVVHRSKRIEIECVQHEDILIEVERSAE